MKWITLITSLQMHLSICKICWATTMDIFKFNLENSKRKNGYVNAFLSGVFSLKWCKEKQQVNQQQGHEHTRLTDRDWRLVQDWRKHFLSHYSMWTEVAAGCSIGSRQAGRGSVMLRVMFCWRTLVLWSSCDTSKCINIVADHVHAFMAVIFWPPSAKYATISTASRRSLRIRMCPLKPEPQSNWKKLRIVLKMLFIELSQNLFY